MCTPIRTFYGVQKDDTLHNNEVAINLFKVDQVDLRGNIIDIHIGNKTQPIILSSQEKAQKEFNTLLVELKKCYQQKLRN